MLRYLIGQYLALDTGFQFGDLVTWHGFKMALICTVTSGLLLPGRLTILSDL